MNDLTELRRELRAARQSLTPAAQAQSSLLIADRLDRLTRYRSGLRVAAYVGSKGELDTMHWLQRAHAAGHACYLPVLHPFLKGRLLFARWTTHSRMQANRFGIPEPVYGQHDLYKPQFLDLVLTPLLGFDANCHRLGMGGGYYDRTFAFRSQRTHWQGPRLIGIAHDVQQVRQLPPKPWDVSLDRVLTPTREFFRKVEQIV